MYSFKYLLLGACISFAPAVVHAASTISEPAPVDLEVPTRWADHAQNRQLEVLLHQAVRAKHTRLLSKSYLELIVNDLTSLTTFRELLLSGNEERIRFVDWQINSCHYAGASIRWLIINTYAESMAHEGRLTTPLRKASVDAFAEHMGRCERVFKRIRLKRLIGTM